LNEDNYFNTNLKRWNDLVDINVKSRYYDLEGFKSGKSSLLPIELDELGDVSGKSLFICSVILEWIHFHGQD